MYSEYILCLCSQVGLTNVNRRLPCGNATEQRF